MIKKDTLGTPNSWAVIKLGDFVETEKGKKPKNEAKTENSVCSLPYVDIQAFEEKVIRTWTDGAACRPCYETDLLMVWDGSRSGLVGKGMNGALGSTLIRINFPSMVNDYAFFFLQSKYQQINTRAKGSGTPHVDPDLLWNYRFPIPPLPEQHRIVAKIEELFSELDKGIENLKTARAQLKVYRQALLKHAFEGKLTAQWRAENPDKLETSEALLKRIQQERAKRFQQQLAAWEASGKQTSKPKPPKDLPPLTTEELTELPELPKGWGWGRLGDIFLGSPKNGIYKSADNYGSGFSIIRIDDFYNGTLCRTLDFKKVKLSADEINTFTAHIGDILINRVNSIEYLGKCCEVKGLTEPVVFESNIMKTTLAANLASKFFVTSYLSSHFGRRRLCANAKHAVNQASINQTDVSMTPIPLAQLGEQIAISELLGAHLSAADQLDQTITASLQQAEALRQSILKQAFSGQLVPQDPHDEPASLLLERIRAERSQAVTSKQRGKAK